ncbi:MAG TPA: hypothetical protein VNG69_10420 [Casimicrobiaceae bacterium]|nr:hypothetical protein [Casimicrobiaceae bacterium]
MSPTTGIDGSVDFANSSSCRAGAQALYSEFIGFVFSGFDGPGTMTWHINASGSFVGAATGSLIASGSLSWSFEFCRRTIGGGLNAGAGLGSDLVVTPSGSGMGVQTITCTVDGPALVIPFPLLISANVGAATHDHGALSGFFFPGDAEMFGSFGSTFEFLGISEIRDSAGNLVEFSAIGESGRDYRIRAVTPPSTVSEPSAVLLIGLALLFAAGLRKQGRTAA